MRELSGMRYDLAPFSQREACEIAEKLASYVLTHADPQAVLDECGFPECPVCTRIRAGMEIDEQPT